MTVSYGEAHDAVDAARARIVSHAMRFAEYSVDGVGHVAYDVLPAMVKSCEEFSAANAVLRSLTDTGFIEPGAYSGQTSISRQSQSS
jgi:hypothetical protein